MDREEDWLLDLSFYVHLNPVRIQGLDLGKKEKQVEALGWSVPSLEVARERIGVLRAFRWSSYAYYAGYKRKIPEWLDVGPVRGRVKSTVEYRETAERKISQGLGDHFLMKLKDRLALDGEAFVTRVRELCSPAGDYEGLREVRRRKSWEDIVAAVERQKGASWEAFSSVRGDWGKAAVFYFARMYAGMTLKEVGAAAGGVNYPAVSQLIKRLEKRMKADVHLRKALNAIDEMLKIQT